MDKEPVEWSALDISRAYARLEKKAEEKKDNLPRCVCGEILTKVNGSLECWRCYPSDE